MFKVYMNIHANLLVPVATKQKCIIYTNGPVNFEEIANSIINECYEGINWYLEFEDEIELNDSLANIDKTISTVNAVNRHLLSLEFEDSKP